MSLVFRLLALWFRRRLRFGVLTLASGLSLFAFRLLILFALGLLVLQQSVVSELLELLRSQLLQFLLVELFHVLLVLAALSAIFVVV